MASFFASLRSSLRHDAPSGLVVFLVALPLCLGIAHASGVPPLAGIVTGVVGGILVAWLSGSHTSISGPAAGLIVIVLGAVNDVGYEGLLLATVLAGAMQIAFGLLKLGGFSRLFPHTVVQGMLVAIGLILLLKQIPHAVGWSADFEGDMDFAQSDGRNTFTEIPFALGHVQLGALIVSSLGLLSILAAEHVPALRRVRWLPGPLLAVALGVGLNALFQAFLPALAIGGELLVDVPALSAASIARPGFELIGDSRVWIAAVTIALIASIETLLCVEAVDGIDPFHRKTPMNRELLAQGAGNLVAGMLGGIPMTAVIVRGSANVQSGARTRMSSFLHGVLLLVAVLALPALMNQIPLAALAAVLLHVGYRLARPQIFMSMVRLGTAHAVPFFGTVAAILFTDLLTGVVLGFVLALLMIVAEGLRARGLSRDGVIKLRLGPTVPWFSRMVLRRSLSGASEGTVIEIDAAHAHDVPADMRAELEQLRERAHERRIEVRVRNLPAVAATSH